MALQQELPCPWPSDVNAFDVVYLDLLRKELRRRCPHVEDDLVDDCIEDAFLALQALPEHWQEDEKLFFYLKAQVQGGISNKLRGEHRRQVHERTAGVFTKDFEDFWKIGVGKSHRPDYLSIEEQDLTRVLACLTTQERAKVALLAEGACWQDWARMLKVEDLSEREQRRLVSTEKERLLKKLRRHLGVRGHRRKQNEARGDQNRIG